MKTFTTANPIAANNINPKIIRLHDYPANYCGVMGNDNTTFFPFYCIVADEDVTFGPDASILYAEEPEFSWAYDRSVSEIRAEYAEHMASSPDKVANAAIFEAVMQRMSEKEGATA